MEQRTTEELVAGLPGVEAAPKDGGVLELIVRRPSRDAREVIERGELTRADGLAGDTWCERGSRHTDDGSAEVDRQLTIMSSRAAALFAGESRDDWALAGDQLYVDIDLSDDNLPPGSRLQIGDAVVEVSEKPHTGCAKFAQRFGMDAARFVNSPDGKRLHLRGINALVVQPGSIAVGDVAKKL